MSATTADRTEGATAWAIQPGALRRLAPVFLAGGLAGIAGGAWVRIVMRLSALAAPETVQGFRTEAGATIGEITFEGTMFLLVFVGIGSAIIGTAFYLAARAWLPTRRPVRAVAFGILELLVFGSLVIDSTNRDFAIVGEARYLWSAKDMGDDFAPTEPGFKNRIDLSGWTWTVGVHVRF